MEGLLGDLQLLGDLRNRLALAEHPLRLTELADDLLGRMPASLHAFESSLPMIVGGKNSHKHRTEQPGSRHGRHLRERDLTPRFLLVHTFAHLLINQLTFECGYSTAALRERLYVSVAESAPMAGVLIYTAAGDAEGTMGGLVRMGKPGYLEPAIIAALRSALWCSADPVCMESGTTWGQGPDSCNLAACHNCALVPETACEEFNRFLDRGVVVGALDCREVGFFDGVA